MHRKAHRAFPILLFMQGVELINWHRRAWIKAHAVSQLVWTLKPLLALVWRVTDFVDASGNLVFPLLDNRDQLIQAIC